VTIGLRGRYDDDPVHHHNKETKLAYLVNLRYMVVGRRWLKHSIFEA